MTSSSAAAVAKVDPDSLFRAGIKPQGESVTSALPAPKWQVVVTAEEWYSINAVYASIKPKSNIIQHDAYKFYAIYHQGSKFVTEYIIPHPPPL